MLFGAIIYLILGLVFLLYILIERYASKAIEARPISYYDLEIDTYTSILYYSSGALLIAASIIIFAYAKLLQSDKEIREKNDQMIEKKFDIEEVSETK